jgi:hypothetical protein
MYTASSCHPPTASTDLQGMSARPRSKAGSTVHVAAEPEVFSLTRMLTEPVNVLTRKRRVCPKPIGQQINEQVSALQRRIEQSWKDAEASNTEYWRSKQSAQSAVGKRGVSGGTTPAGDGAGQSANQRDAGVVGRGSGAGSDSSSAQDEASRSWPLSRGEESAAPPVEGQGGANSVIGSSGTADSGGPLSGEGSTMSQPDIVKGALRPGNDVAEVLEPLSGNAPTNAPPPAELTPGNVIDTAKAMLSPGNMPDSPPPAQPPAAASSGNTPGWEWERLLPGNVVPSEPLIQPPPASTWAPLLPGNVPPVPSQPDRSPPPPGNMPPMPGNTLPEATPRLSPGNVPDNVLFGGNVAPQQPFSTLGSPTSPRPPFSPTWPQQGGSDAWPPRSGPFMGGQSLPPSQGSYSGYLPPENLPVSHAHSAGGASVHTVDLPISHAADSVAHNAAYTDFFNHLPTAAMQKAAHTDALVVSVSEVVHGWHPAAMSAVDTVTHGATCMAAEVTTFLSQTV